MTDQPEPAKSDPENPANSDPTEEEEQLRSWYLARLRSTLRKGMTPVALIDVDKEFIQSLAEEWTKGQDGQPAIIKRPIGLVGWIAGILIGGMCLYFAQNGHVPQTIDAYYRLTLGLVLGQGPADLFKAGLPLAFLSIPCFVLGWPVFWFIILPMLRRKERANS